MNLIQYAKRRGAVDAFLRTLGPGIGGCSLFETPTEEVIHDLHRGRQPRMHKMADNGVVGRVEPNYLYYTRRFPQNTANNTIGSGAVVAGDYLFFTNGIGDQGTAAGYFSIANLTLQQTNMASGGKIPTGRGYQLFEIGITFNAGAAPGDITQCLDTMNLRYEKQNSSLVVQHGPIKFWPGGMGIYGFAGTATTVAATTTTIQGASNGMPALSNVRKWKDPRILGSNEQFQYVINAAANTPNVNAAVALTAFVEITIWMFGNCIDRIPG